MTRTHDGEKDGPRRKVRGCILVGALHVWQEMVSSPLLTLHPQDMIRHDSNLPGTFLQPTAPNLCINAHTGTRLLGLRPIHQGCCGYPDLVPIAMPRGWGRGRGGNTEKVNKEQQLQN